MSNIIILFSFLFTSNCATKKLKITQETAKQIEIQPEIDIQQTPPPPNKDSSLETPSTATQKTGKRKKTTIKAKGKSELTTPKPPEEPPQPWFRVGEETQFEVSYMGMVAGYLNLSVLPITYLNGVPHYHFRGRIWSAPFFSKIYFVDDSFESFINIKTLLPSMYNLKVNETQQVKQAVLIIDQEARTARYHEKKIRSNNELKETKLAWTLDTPAQDIFSCLFFLRTLPWDQSRHQSFLVTDDEKMFTYKGQIVAEEDLEIQNRVISSIKIKPEVKLQGQLKNTGEFFLWLDKNDRYRIVQISAKLSFGSLKAKAIELK